MKTKEEIFNKIPFLDKNGDYFNMPRERVLAAMEEYANYYHDTEVKKLSLSHVSGRNSKSELRDELAKQLFVALIANPKRYEYIEKWMNKPNANKTQEEATLKNINKAYKLADSFLNYVR